VISTPYAGLLCTPTGSTNLPIASAQHASALAAGACTLQHPASALALRARCQPAHAFGFVLMCSVVHCKLCSTITHHPVRVSAEEVIIGHHLSSTVGYVRASMDHTSGKGPIASHVTSGPGGAHCQAAALGQILCTPTCRNN
jgi:hypothetical protein